MTGLQIRQFLRELFGSRLNAHMEDELFRLRGDYETRLQERETRIAELKEQVSQLTSKVDRYELVLLPLTSPMGQFFAPKKERPPLVPAEDGPKSWQEVQLEWDAEQAKEAQAEKKPV
jgi:hypothetical protein